MERKDVGRVAGKYLVFLILLLAVLWQPAVSVSENFIHPMMQPEKFTDYPVCENCGMNRNMWGRTRHVFSNSEGTHYTCSIHCLADLSAKTEETPQNVMVALYTDPSTEIRAEKAVYVVGSTAPGTMTMNSKLAFAGEAAAKAFSEANGGELKTFEQARVIAEQELPIARKSIADKRLKTGKTVIPYEKDQCQVCGMYPARFPDFRSQIYTMDNKTVHFCSTSCLVKYLANPSRYQNSVPKIMMTWVTVYPEQTFDYADGLFYVVGSKVMGSMGPEALPFREKSAAEAFVKENGGEVLRFRQISPEKIGSTKMH